MAEVSAVDPRYAEALQFLYFEAQLLDDQRHTEWLDLLTEDISYQMPVRRNLKGGGPSAYSEETNIFSENLASLRVRVHKLSTEYAWAETPPSRTRHHISNVRVSEADREDELRVSSNVLVYRTRGDDPTPDLFSAERQDVLRRVNGSWRLASRLVLLDQTVVGTRHLAILI